MMKLQYLVVFIISFFSFIKIHALDNILINDEYLSPLFSSDTYEYNYFTNKDKVKISVSKSSDEQVSGYGYFNLNDGVNEFYITSVKNNIESKYKINVYRNYKKDDKSIATFKSFNIENYDINFSNEVYEYSIDIEDDEYLNINYELTSPSSTVEIKGNGNFTNENNKVIIKITSEDKKISNEYVIHVNKVIEVFKVFKSERSITHAERELAKIVIVIMCCVLVVFIFYLLFIKKIF